MAERERTTQNKQTDVDQTHRVRQKESEPSFDQFHAWDTGPFSLTETPFVPCTGKHVESLAMSPSDEARANLVLHLQQTYGNKYVQRLIESRAVQAKLTVNAPNDIYEQEADRVADAVTRTVNSQAQRQEVPEEEEEIQMKTSQVQRQEVPEEEEEVQAQSADGQPDTVSENIEARIDNAQGSGHPLSDNIKEPMEQAFGADFSGVRVHTDSQADLLNQQLSAKAFTTARDIFFRQGEYSNASDSGRKLIAHELSHVLQQTQRAPLQHQGKKREEEVQTKRSLVKHQDDGEEAKIQAQSTSNPLLQRTVNGKAVQRMVALAHPGHTDYNWTDYVGLSYAYNKAGPPVNLLKDCDLVGLEKTSTLAIRAHGSQGALLDYDAKQLANDLSSKMQPRMEPIAEILISSCEAGAGSPNSVVDTVKDELSKIPRFSGIPVRGSTGILVPWFKENREYTGIVDSRYEVQQRIIQAYIQSLFKLTSGPAMYDTATFIGKTPEEQAAYIEKFVRETDKAMQQLFIDMGNTRQSLVYKSINKFLNSNRTQPRDQALIDTLGLNDFDLTRTLRERASDAKALLDQAVTLYVNPNSRWLVR